MSPDRPIACTHSTVGNIINNDSNMVVSLPINVSSNTVLVLNNHNLITSTQSPVSSGTMTTTCYNNNNNTSTLSKYLMIDPQQHMNDTNSNYNIIKTEKNDSINVNYNHSNIVVLATQQLEPTQNSTDEELTPLTWLHDKNLLKGINLSCPKVRSVPGSPQHHLSPTSDFLEDSCISEENSSANSNSDNGILLSPVESTASSTLYYHTKNNNNLISNKNRSAISSPTSSSSSSSSPPSSLSLASSMNMSPNRQTIVEYQLTNHMIDENVSLNNNNNNSVLIQSSTPHQHFHKKYLREEHVKTLKQTINPNNITNSAINQQFISPIKIEPFDNTYSTTPTKITTICRSLSNDVTSSSNIHIPRQLPAQNESNTVTINSKLLTPTKQKHPSNIAYDPQIHTHNKPPFSFSSLIFMAIEDAPEKALPVKEIYAWIVQHFPYFKTAPTGWKNSVRHNLSLSKSFQKVEKAPNMGKGSLWRVDQHYRHNLVQTVTRSQFHPCATIEKTSMKSILRPSDTMDPIENIGSNTNGVNGRPLNAELFPRLSKCMAEFSSIEKFERPSPSSTPPDEDYNMNYQNNDFIINDISTNNNNTTLNNNNITPNGSLSPERLARDFGVENIDDVNAATAMLALKHGPKIFNEQFHSPIITSSPSEDHTYSQGGVPPNTVRASKNSDNNSNGTSSDAAYESSEEVQYNNNNNHYHFNQNNISNDELEEQRRHAEGVDALLNLAGVSFTSPIILKRPSSTTLVDLQQPLNNQDILNGNTQITLNAPCTTVTAIYQHSPPKKYKTKTLRNKLKKKVWMR